MERYTMAEPKSDQNLATLIKDMDFLQQTWANGSSQENFKGIVDKASQYFADYGPIMITALDAAAEMTVEERKRLHDGFILNCQGVIGKGEFFSDLKSDVEFGTSHGLSADGNNPYFFEQIKRGLEYPFYGGVNVDSPNKVESLVNKLKEFGFPG